MSYEIKIISPYGSQIYFLEKNIPYGGAEVRAKEITKSLIKDKKIKDVTIFVQGADDHYKQTFYLPKLKIKNINFIPTENIKIHRLKIIKLLAALKSLSKNIIINFFSINTKISIKIIDFFKMLKKIFLDTFWIFISVIASTFFFIIFFFNSLQLGLKIKKKDQVFIFGVNSFNYYLSIAINFFSKKNIILFLTSDDNVNDKVFDPKLKGEYDNYKSLLIYHYKLLKISNKIVCQNTYQKEQISKFFPEKNNIILKCPVEVEEYKNISLDEKIYDFIWIGKIDRVKGFDCIIELLKLFPHCKFAIFSSSMNLEYDELDFSFIDNENLNFFKYANSDFVCKTIKKSKFLINTSLFEGFPNTFLEALKFEVPLISLNVNPDNLFDFNLGFFANSNKKALIKILNKCSNINDGEYEILKKNCKEYLNKFHQQKDFNNKLLDFISIN